MPESCHVRAPRFTVGLRTAPRANEHADGRSQIPLSHALLVSAVVHGVLIVLLSLVVFSGKSRPEAVIVAGFSDDNESEPVMMTVPELQDVELVAVDTRPSTAAAESLLLDESVPDIPSTFLNRKAAEDDSLSAPETGPRSRLQEQAVSEIQARVEQAGGKSGEVQFALSWRNVNDLDLHTIAPSGERVSFSHKRSQCAGFLDVDMNVDGDDDEPVENVRWLKGRAPAGRYTVLVHLFRVHAGGRFRSGADITDYQLLARLGDESQLLEQTVRMSDRLMVHRFYYVPATVNFPRRQRMLNQLTQQQESDERKAQPLLERALVNAPGASRDQMLNDLIRMYPHTDAAIEAMQLLGSDITK